MHWGKVHILPEDNLEITPSHFVTLAGDGAEKGSRGG